MSSKKQLLPIFVVVFIDLLGFSIILPLLPYYAKQYEDSPVTIGFLIASYSICQFIAAPILGDLSDRYGRKPVLLYSQIGSCLGFILLGTALHLPNPLVWLFIARIIDGFSGGNLSVAQAYISDITKPEDRAKTFGMIIGVSFGLGFTLGPAMGAELSTFGFDVPAYVAAALSFTSVIATAIMLPETPHLPDDSRPKGFARYTRVFDYLKVNELRRLFSVFFLMSVPFALYVSLFALYADKQLNFTAKEAGRFLALIGFLGIIWQGGIIGPIVKRFGDFKTLVFGLTASAVGMYYLVTVDSWWKLLIVGIFFSLGHGIARPSLTSLVTQAAPDNRRGGALGSMASIESFSRIIAPIFGGFIIKLHPSYMGWVGGILFTLAVIVAVPIGGFLTQRQEETRTL